MKIALVKTQDSAKSLLLTAVQYPVNLGYLAAVCLQAGHAVEIWDFCVEPFEDAYILEKLRRFAPDIVGLSCVTPAIGFGHHVAALAKAFNPDLYTVVGGCHVSALPVETLEEFPYFDAGVTVEAEDILLEIIQALEANRLPEGITGTVYRQNGSIVLAPQRDQLPDVNALPYPNRDLVPFHLYQGKHALRGFTRQVWNIAEVDSSRGCPYACTFCAVQLTHGRGARFRTPENVLGEIEELRRRYDTNFIVFNDSTFTVRKDRVHEIVRHLPGLGIEGYTINAHVNTVDQDMLDALARTGCAKISFGVESGSDKTLKRVRKNSTRRGTIAAFEAARKARLPTVEGTFILGADLEETEEDFRATESIIKVLSPDIIAVGIITPYPGTPQYTEMRAAGVLDGVAWEQYQIFAEEPPPWRTTNFSAEELVQRRTAILKSYIWTPRYVLNRLRRIKSFTEFLYYARLALSFFKVVVREKAARPVAEPSGTFPA